MQKDTHLLICKLPGKAPTRQDGMRSHIEPQSLGLCGRPLSLEQDPTAHSATMCKFLNLSEPSLSHPQNTGNSSPPHRPLVRIICGIIYTNHRTIYVRSQDHP